MSGAILACSDPQLMAARSFRMADDAQKIEMMLTHLESEMWTVNMMGEQSLRAKLCALDELNDYSRKLQEELDAAEFEQKSRSKKWKSLLVRKLPETATEDDLWAAISVFGEVDSVSIVRGGKNSKNGKSKCFGFANFSNHDDAATCLEALTNGEVILTDCSSKPRVVRGDWAHKSGHCCLSICTPGVGVDARAGALVVEGRW